MPREGGYGKSTKAEWVKTSRKLYGEALISSDLMGQDLETWLADAIAFHVYRCELIQAKERYAADCKAAADGLRPSPLEADYKPSGTAPTITRIEGKGSDPQPGRSYRR